MSRQNCPAHFRQPIVGALALASGDIRAERGGDCIHDNGSGFGLEIVEDDSRSAEAVPPPAACQDKRHRGGRNLRILVADQRLEELRPSALVASQSFGQPLFFGSAKKESDEVGNVENARASKPLPNLFALIVRGLHRPERGTHFVGERVEEVRKHPRHQRAFLLRQPGARIQEEVDSSRTQAASPRVARRGSLATLGGGKWPFDRHHRVVINALRLTSGQPRAIRWFTCWATKKETAA